MSSNLKALGALLFLAAPLTAQTVVTSQRNAPRSAATLRGLLFVTHTGDSGTGSLRWAINQANLRAGADVIRFRIPGAGVHTIVPGSQLPPLTDPAGTLIDGLSQPGASCGANPPSTATLRIEIAGSAAGGAHGIWVQSDNNRVRGLIINRFQRDGIRIEGGLANTTASFNVAGCNYVGTDASGAIDMGNGTDLSSLHGGVHICNVAGGVASFNKVRKSLISANYADGVWVEGPRQPGDVGNNTVGQNYIGTDASGTVDLGNDHEGVALTEGTHDNQVIENLVSGNDTDGVGVQGFNNLGFPDPPIQTSNNLIAENTIGLDVNGGPLPNSMHGVAIGLYGSGQWGCADGNTIRKNVIAFNGGDGVAVVEDFIDTFNADHNRITQNSIFDNGGLGIDLVDDMVTLNDPGDFDSAPNQEVNFPLMLSAMNMAGMTTVSGMIAIDTNPALATVEVFKARFDPSGHGEGEIYLGSTTPDALGNWTFMAAGLVSGDFITATTTDQAQNTSEFCQNIMVP